MVLSWLCHCTASLSVLNGFVVLTKDNSLWFHPRDDATYNICLCFVNIIRIKWLSTICGQRSTWMQLNIPFCRFILNSNILVKPQTFTLWYIIWFAPLKNTKYDVMVFDRPQWAESGRPGNASGDNLTQVAHSTEKHDTAMLWRLS